MASVAETLKELHSLHVELAEAHSKLKRGPLQIKARETEFAKQEQQLEKEREALRRRRIEADQKELALKTGEQKVKDLQIKLNLVKSNKEYSALQEEIRKVQETNGKLEEEILEAMTEQETAAEQVEKLAAAVTQAGAELERFKETTRYTLEKMESRLGLLQSKITELARQLPGDVQENYRKLVDQKAERTIAACENGTCQECFTGQTPQAWNDLVAGKAVTCHTCGAILYKV